jgi:signal transduction histidine kinase/CheY-like chemotaxis protein
MLSALGSVLGGLLSWTAVQTLSEQAGRLARFERTWSEALWIDQMATHAAKSYTLTQNSDDKQQFDALISPREERLAQAVALASHSTNHEILTRVYKSSRAMESFEVAAVALAHAGKLEEGQSLLRTGQYALEGSRKTRQLEKARKEISLGLQAQVDEAFRLLALGFAALFAGILAGGACWAKVAGLFKRQTDELAQAHNALAIHAETLETRIVKRTAALAAAKVAAESADFAKSAFLAQMSHEIRTPMNGVLGMADALSRTILDERQTRMVKVIQDSGDTLLTLLNDVLDIAKIEAGKLDLETIDYSLVEIVRSAEAIFTARAHDKGISFSCQIDQSADIWCLGDPTRVRQILYNLVSNALKFTHEGSVCVSLIAEPTPLGTQRITLAVSDTGVGLDEEAQGRLFQRFSQADASTTRKFGGTGLGLAICKQLAGMMHGDITVRSQPGLGSTFTFVHEARLGAAPLRTDAATLESSLCEDEGSGASLRVLAAEDNAHNRLVLQMFLDQVGIEPVFAENGAIAVELWKQAHFDLILMDVQMPEMSGPEATQAIRALEQTTGRTRTPIIALTANAMTHHVRECLDAGMDAHVAKPIRPEILFAAITQALEGPGSDVHPGDLLAGVQD